MTVKLAYKSIYDSGRDWAVRGRTRVTKWIARCGCTVAAERTRAAHPNNTADMGQYLVTTYDYYMLLV